MKLFLKLTSFAIGLLLLAVIVVVTIINPNDHKQKIQDQVKHLINRDLTIEGDMSWSLYPVLGFNIGKITLYNNAGFTEKTLLTVQKTAISLSVLPLFQGQLEVGEIILDGAEFNLITSKEGLSNLDNLKTTDTTTIEPTTPSNTEKSENTSEPLDLAKFVLSGVNITNATLQIIDHTKDDHQKIAIDKLQLSEFAFDKSSHLSFSSIFKNSQIEADIKLEADLLIDAALTKLSLSNVNIESKVLSQALLNSTLTTSFNSGLEYQLTTQQLDIDNIKMNNILSGPLLQGNVDINMSGIQLLENNELTLGTLNITSDLSGSTLKNTQIKTSFLTQLTANINNKTVNIDKLELKNALAGNALNGHLDLSFQQLTISDFEKILIKNFNINSELDGELLNKRKLKTTIETDITYELTQQKVTLSTLKSTLNDIDLKGKFSFENQTIPVIRYSLKGNIWDLNPYLTANTEPTKEATPTTPDTKEKVEIQPDLSILKELDIIGDLTLEGVLYEDITIGKITSNLIVKDGEAFIKPFTADLYDGSLYVNAWVDESKGKNQYKVTTKIDNVTLLPLLKDTAKQDILSGTIHLNLSADGQGLTTTQIQQGINAKGDFKIQDGEVYGINLSQKLRTFKAKLKGQVLPIEESIKKTDFASLIGEFTMQKGTVNNEKLILLSPVMRLDGTGLVDIIKEQLDYKLSVTPLSDSTEKTDYIDLNGITIPLLIKGTFTEPTFELDTESALKKQIEVNKKALQEKAKKAITDKLQGKSNDELKEEGKKLTEKFKGFFK